MYCGVVLTTPPPGYFFVCSWTPIFATIYPLGIQVIELLDGFNFWHFLLTTTLAYWFFFGSVLHFALIFPKPLTLIVQHPRVIWLFYILPLVIFPLCFLAARMLVPSTLVWVSFWTPATTWLSLIYILPAILGIVWQYRISRDIEARMKLRWVVYGFLLSGLGLFVVWIFPTLFTGQSLVSQKSIGLFALPIPVTLTIAVLRYHLFDIDLIIRRTATYFLLTAFLVIVFFISVIGLEQTFSAITGAGQNELVTVISTLVIAALFVPLRNRIQSGIDRRFNRQRYDAQKVLAQFAAAARDETDLERLSGRLLEAVELTMQPTSTSIRLKDMGKELLSATRH